MLSEVAQTVANFHNESLAATLALLVMYLRVAGKLFHMHCHVSANFQDTYSISYSETFPGYGSVGLPIGKTETFDILAGPRDTHTPQKLINFH